MSSANRYRPLILVSLLIAWVAFLVARAATTPPWFDEALVANPAWNLARNGSMGTTGMFNPAWPRIDRHTFNSLPAGIFAAATVFRIFGCSPLAVRIPQIVFAVLGVLSVFRIVRMLTGDTKRALFSAVLVGLDYNYIFSATSGRVDMMTLSLGLLAQAVYLTLREDNLRLALLVSSGLLTAAALTHPAAIFPIVWMLALILWLDRSRLNYRSIVPVLIFPLIGAAAWIVYISRDPSAAWVQLTSNAAAHKTLISLSELRESLTEEIRFRYFRRSPAVPGNYFPKVILTGVYFISAVASVLMSVRLPERHADKFFLGCLVFSAAFLAFVDAEKMQYGYMVYVSPLCMIVAAGVICRPWKRWRPVRWVIASAVATAVVAGLVALTGQMLKDEYHNGYLPAAQTLSRAARAGQTVMAPVPWFFGYGLDGRAVRWITVASWPARLPDFVIAAASDPLPHLFDGWRIDDPAAYEKIAAHARFELIYHSSDWLIYRCTP